MLSERSCSGTTLAPGGRTDIEATVSSEDLDQSTYPLTDICRGTASEAGSVANGDDDGFQLVQPLQINFKLPSGKMLAKTFPDCPTYEDLQKAIHELAEQPSMPEFHVMLDEVQLNNENTGPELQKLTSPVHLMVKEGQQDSEKISMAPACDANTESDSSRKSSPGLDGTSTNTTLDAQANDEFVATQTIAEAEGTAVGSSFTHSAALLPAPTAPGDPAAAVRSSTPSDYVASLAATASANPLSVAAVLAGGGAMIALVKNLHANSTLKQGVAERDAENTKLKEQNEKMSRQQADKAKELDDTKEQLMRKDRELDSKSSENINLKREVSNKEKDNIELKGRVENLTSGNVKLQEHNRNIAKERDEKEQLITQILKQQSVDKLINGIKQYNAADLLFMVDCTGSMGPYIEGVKNQIKSIVKRLRAQYPQLNLRIGFLGYRDLHDPNTQFEIFDPDSDVNDFIDFLRRVQPIYNRDKAEDLAGALKKAAAWPWQHSVRVLFHLADDPCHGLKYHNDKFAGNRTYDLYPDGTPNINMAEELAKLMEEHAVDYYFGRITDRTDKMILELNKELGSSYIKMVPADEPWKIEGAVVQSVRTSIDVSRLGQTASKAARVTVLDADAEWHILESSTPQSCSVYQLEPQDSIHAIRQKELSKWQWIPGGECVVLDVPFAYGESRTCHWGVYRGEPGAQWQHMVFKKTKEKALGGNGAMMQRCASEVEKSVVADFFARKFNDSECPEKPLEFLVPQMVHITDTNAYYNVEPVLPNYRSITKFNDNKGIWTFEKYKKELGDFCRWMHDYSKGEFLIADLQGVEDDRKFVMTDPVVLCSDITRFGNTNTGPAMIDETLRNIPCHGDPLMSRL
mmetsp:Transcript_23244/g.42313  ORF Transcript_23244/g.42313 Transcript_23244/m.42313 type:complete len:860 (-) Transcript_23244:1-2580(-)